MLVQLLAVGCGGFVGAIARYGISSLAHHYYNGPFAVGTLAVNAVGCLALGALMTLMVDHQFFSATARLFLVTGILGALTTFSTFGHETLEHLRDGDHVMALINIAANLVLGIGATILGSSAARWFA